MQLNSFETVQVNLHCFLQLIPQHTLAFKNFILNQISYKIFDKGFQNITQVDGFAFSS